MISPSRPDFSKGVIHFTRRRIGQRRHFEFATRESLKLAQLEIEPLEVMKEILRDGAIRGSTNAGFIKGHQRAVCFSELPLSNARYFVESGRYSFYGIATSKRAAFDLGARPVIYIPDEEGAWIPQDQKWRQVRFELGRVDFTHEREWRLPGDLNLHQLRGFYVLTRKPSEDGSLSELLAGYKNVLGVLPMEHLLALF
jgi:hypothetical protein